MFQTITIKYVHSYSIYMKKKVVPKVIIVCLLQKYNKNRIHLHVKNVYAKTKYSKYSVLPPILGHLID